MENPKVAAINKHITSQKEKMNNRMARLLWETQELEPSYNIVSSAPRTLQQSNLENLKNPLVVASILAGFVGVVIIAVIILGVWVRSKLNKRQRRNNSTYSLDDNRKMDHVETDSAVNIIMASSSTLNDIDETQTECIQMNDTTFYSAHDISIPIDGIGNTTYSENEESMNCGRLDERTLCNISLSPI